MYYLKRFINKKATIYDDVNDVSMTYDFETLADAETFVITQNKEILKADLASYRYDKEVEGINFGGVVIRTDRESQAQFNAAYSAMKDGITDTITWKGNGRWVEIDKNTATEIAQMTVAHVQKCFKCEKSISENIDALNTIPEVENFVVSDMWDSTFGSL